MNANSTTSFNSHLQPSALSNQDPSEGAKQTTLRDALLDCISPEEVAQAQARASAATDQPAKNPPRQRKRSQPAARGDSLRPAAADEPQPADSAQHEPQSDRHSRKCAICHHPERESIDLAYAHWASPRDIVWEYKLPSRLALYRHALATGLSEARRGKAIYALEKIIEQAGDTEPSADAVIRAIRACSRLNEHGRWTDPPRRVILDHHSAAAALPAPRRQLPAAATPQTITIEHSPQITSQSPIPSEETES